MKTRFLWWLLLAALVLTACGGRPVVGGDASTDLGPPDMGTPDVRTCVAATDCDDGIACTVDECSPVGGCVHRPMDSMCADDGIACTVEQCQVGRGCASVPDNSRCTGNQVCRPDMMGCFEAPRCSSPNDPRCDDGQPCTDDRCDMATGRCAYTAHDEMCADTTFCNGEERCVPFRGCLPGPAVRCDDGVACTIDQCNEAMRRCDNLPENRLCDDGQFCNGREVCNPTMGCQAGTAPTCDDGNACTTDRCDNTLNRCANTPRDVDGDGDPDRACGGGDCDDANAMVSSRTAETCNMRDDNCNGMVDEGVLSACGDCDPTCRRRTVGAGGSTFADAGRRGTEVDPSRGLVISATTSVADYLWVPNTAESTVSKWDAATGREIARYRVGLPSGECRGACCWASGCNQPSRVAVDGNGDVYIANRGFSMQGTVTKIAADRRDCVDRNGNGMIDTSTSATPLPYGADECVLWTANVGPVDAVLRALTVDRGDMMFPQGYPWVGGYNNRVFYKLNPRTGAVLSMVSVPVSPYGAVVTADGRLWIGTLNSGGTAYIDTATNAVSPFIGYPIGMRSGCRNSYGITADNRGRIWFAGWDCRDALGFDPRSGQWTRVDLTPIIPPGGYAGRGITVESTGRVWLAWSASGESQSRLAYWDSDGFVPGGNITSLAVHTINVSDAYQGPSGVGIDRNGNLWLAHHITSELFRYTPSTGVRQTFTGANRVYTYSDFTGSVRRTVIGQGTYSEDFDAGCNNPTFNTLEWDADAPAGTSVSFAAGTAATTAGLDTAMSIAVATAPRDPSPADIAAAFTAASITPRRYVRVVVTLRASSTGVSPALRSLHVTWHCP
jgi:hypothetical protein